MARCCQTYILTTNKMNSVSNSHSISIIYMSRMTQKTLSNHGRRVKFDLTKGVLEKRVDRKNIHILYIIVSLE